MAGLFVTIEGIEGSGTSTLAAALAEELKSAGREVVVTAEPGGGAVGESIRRLLLDSTDAISAKSELLLFEAARAQHVDTVILPALERGAVVICDRFADSSIAYQGGARGIDAATVRSLNDYATSGLKPHLTILLDLPVADGLARQQKTDRMSSEKAAFHEAVREAYLSLAEAEPDRFVVIDAGLDLDEVVRQAVHCFEAESAHEA